MVPPYASMMSRTHGATSPRAGHDQSDSPRDDTDGGGGCASHDTAISRFGFCAYRPTTEMKKPAGIKVAAYNARSCVSVAV
jgi:hypothetical protein